MFLHGQQCATKFLRPAQVSIETGYLILPQNVVFTELRHGAVHKARRPHEAPASVAIPRTQHCCHVALPVPRLQLWLQLQATTKRQQGSYHGLELHLCILPARLNSLLLLLMLRFRFSSLDMQKSSISCKNLGCSHVNLQPASCFQNFCRGCLSFGRLWMSCQKTSAASHAQ